MRPTASLLDRSFASRLVWQQQRQEARKDNQGSCDVHRDRRLQICVERDDRRQNTENARGSSRQSVSSTSIFGGENLRGHSVQHTIHDVTEKRVPAIPAQERVRGPGRGARKEKHACEPYLSQGGR